MELAPIVLFVYNRPQHTEKTLSALDNNDFSSESELFIFADGPKKNATTEEIEKINEVRRIIRKKSWCNKVNIIESSSNRGLADSIVEGVTEIVNKFGKVIVLEDDIVTSPGFLRFMNDSLEYYKNNPEVMHISGYMYPVDTSANDEIYFLRIYSCWGWATWDRAWKNFNFDIDYHFKKLRGRKKIRKFNIEGHGEFYGQILANKFNAMRTWAVRWYSSWFLSGGISLFPYKSLVMNIGYDSSGENCSDKQNIFVSDTIDYLHYSKKEEIGENHLIRQKIDDFYKANFKLPPLKVRLRKYIKRRIRLMVGDDIARYIIKI